MTGSAKRDQAGPRAATNGLGHHGAQQTAPGLDRVIQAQIGDKLRAMYGELVEQPVPDRLTALIGRLGQQSGSETGS